MNLKNEPVLEVNVSADGQANVLFRGRLDATAVASAWNNLGARLSATKVKQLALDASGLDSFDGAGLALLQYLNQGKMTPRATISLSGLKDELKRLLNLLTAEDYEAFHLGIQHKTPLPEEVGRATREVTTDLREQVDFLGNLTASFAGTLGSLKRTRWAEVWHVAELAGANAVPIVSLISVLVGLIIAFESAQPMAEFGAQLYVANMIGLVMVRELGPLMTAILLAGRSGSAFAAELGTMKVNEELNALETFGLEPMRFLVVQRVTAGVLLCPTLTAYSMFMGVLGGVLVLLWLGFPLALIWNQMQESVHLRDVALGISKGFVFGAIVSAVGCLRGLQTRQGPSAVGVSTTRAVVTSILLIIIADAIFSVLFFLPVKL